MPAPRPRSIRPLSEIPRADVEAYLRAQGHSPELITWKYFDETFNAGRERGFVWLRDDAVAGFIGVMPFPLASGGQVREANWSFDWSLASPTATPGMGVKVLQSAISALGEVYTLGGNANTRALLPRIAQFGDEDAAMTVMRPLRVGYWVDRLRLRFPGLPVPHVFDRLTVSFGSSTGARIVPGVSRDLAAVLDAQTGFSQHDGPDRPAYDLPFLEWMLGRCPLLDVWTVMAGTGGPMEAGAVVWRLHESPRTEWRVVHWQMPGADAAARTVLHACAHHARDHGATVLAAMVSLNDTQRVAAFSDTGFKPRRGRHPLYISSKSTEPGPRRPTTGLSFLDTDMAYIL